MFKKDNIALFVDIIIFFIKIKKESVLQEKKQLTTKYWINDFVWFLYIPEWYKSNKIYQRNSLLHSCYTATDSAADLLGQSLQKRTRASALHSKLSQILFSPLQLFADVMDQHCLLFYFIYYLLFWCDFSNQNWSHVVISVCAAFFIKLPCYNNVL